MTEAAPPAAPTPRGPDILARTAPPLSATSDMPLAPTAQPPAAASNSPADQATGTPAEISAETQGAATKAKQDGAPTPEPVEAKPDPDPDPEPTEITVDGKKVETPPWMKKELVKVRDRQRTSDARAAAAEAKSAKDAETVAELRRELDSVKAKLAPPPPEAKPEPKPERDKFATPNEYDDALAAWGEKEGARKAAERAATDKAAADKAASDKAAEDQRKAADAELAKLNTTWAERKAKAIEAHPDFEEVALSSAVAISIPMSHAILIAENGPDMAYHLGKNPDEAARISALPTVGAQLFEMGKLAARLAAPPTRAARTAPIAPLTGNSSPADTSARELSMEEWAAKRNPEISASRRPFISAPPPGPARH